MPRPRSLLVWLIVAASFCSAQAIDLTVDGDQTIEVEDLLQQVATATGQRIVVDQALQGRKIRLLGSLRVSFEELRSLLAMYDIELLREHHADGSLIKAYNRRNLASQALGRVTRFFGEGSELPAANELVTSVMAVEYVDPEQVFSQIRALMSRDSNRLGNILFVRGSKRLVITDTAPNVRAYMEVIAAFDVAPPELQTRCIALKHAHASDVQYLTLELLESRRAVTQEQGMVVPPRARITADDRTNSLLVSGLEADLLLVSELVGQLDVPVMRRRCWPVPVQHASAEALAQILGRLFSMAQRSVLFGADQRTNTLLVHGQRSDLEEVLDVLKTLDAEVGE